MANSLLNASAHHVTQMPDEPHSLRKPRHLTNRFNELLRVSMRITTTTLYEHTNLLAVELVVESNKKTIDRNGRNSSYCYRTNSTLLSNERAVYTLLVVVVLAIMLSCIIFRKMVVVPECMVVGPGKIPGTGYSTCGSHSCDQEEVLKCDWWSHVTVMSQ